MIRSKPRFPRPVHFSHSATPDCCHCARAQSGCAFPVSTWTFRESRGCTPQPLEEGCQYQSRSCSDASALATGGGHWNGCCDVTRLRRRYVLRVRTAQFRAPEAASHPSMYFPPHTRLSACHQPAKSLLLRTFRSNLLAGKSSIGQIERFDPHALEFSTTIAGEIKGEPPPHMTAARATLGTASLELRSGVRE